MRRSVRRFEEVEGATLSTYRSIISDRTVDASMRVPGAPEIVSQRIVTISRQISGWKTEKRQSPEDHCGNHDQKDSPSVRDPRNMISSVKILLDAFKLSRIFHHEILRSTLLPDSLSESLTVTSAARSRVTVSS